MSKTNGTKPHILGWYQPHPTVGFDGLLLDPVTGEYKKPTPRTKQEFKDQCDINNVIKEFTRTGQINHISAAAARGTFIDLPDDLDYQSSLNIVLRAEESFMALPAKVRDRFDNDPAAFLAFVTNPANADELIELGIREPPPRTGPTEPASGSGGAGGTPPAASTPPASQEPSKGS